jgi:hypothetical protein
MVRLTGLQPDKKLVGVDQSELASNSNSTRHQGATWAQLDVGEVSEMEEEK